MEESILGIIGSLFVMPIAIIAMVIYLRKYSNMERMRLIENGIDPSEINRMSKSGKFSTLRFALLFIGFGLGLIIGYILDTYTGMDEIAYFSMLFIFGGMGLGAAYMVEEKKEK